MLHTFLYRRRWTVAVLASLMVLSACSSRLPPPEPSREPLPELQDVLIPLGFTVQAGAFADVNNAIRLTDHLNSYAHEAYYFVCDRGLYRVRFGDFATRESALQLSSELQSEGIIEEYYIVRPDEYSLAKRPALGDGYLRDQLVTTARGFLGVPYRWGGDSPDDGFDCSGLAMSVYRLNGLNLPRRSSDQFRSGRPVNRRSLAAGDLVFFDTRGRGTVSHVGIYAGEGRFIHAPRTGRTVSLESLDDTYFRTRFLGARTYL